MTKHRSEMTDTITTWPSQCGMCGSVGWARRLVAQAESVGLAHGGAHGVSGTRSGWSTGLVGSVGWLVLVIDQ
jgi:hypothetical protein